MAEPIVIRFMPALLALALLALSGCSGSDEAPSSVTVQIKDRSFTLDVAADPDSREKGLGGREVIPPDGGMIFIFPRPEMQRFWMRDCLSDIDLIFMDARGFVTAVHRMTVEPPRAPDESETEYLDRLTGYSSNHAAQFAIELAPGMLDELGIGFQDRIELDLERLKAVAR